MTKICRPNAAQVQLIVCNQLMLNGYQCLHVSVTVSFNRGCKELHSTAVNAEMTALINENSNNTDVVI